MSDMLSQVKVFGYHDDLQKIRDYWQSRRETEAASLRLHLAIKEKENKTQLLNLSITK